MRPCEALLPAPLLEAPDVLVVAVPEHEARVRHRAASTLSRDLGLDLAPERLLLGVGGAGEQEVLPDEDAALVAQLVEVVATRSSRRPRPAAGSCSRTRPGRGGRARRRAVDAGDERVVGDPVGAADPDRLAVDDEAERGALIVAVRVRRRPCGNRSAAPGRRAAAPVATRSLDGRGRRAAARRSRAATTAPTSSTSSSTHRRTLAGRDVVTGIGASTAVDARRRASPHVHPSTARSSTCTRDAAASSPSTVTTGRTAAERAPDQACSVTGFHIPTEAASSPQSQPKLQAALRMRVERVEVGVRAVADVEAGLVGVGDGRGEARRRARCRPRPAARRPAKR